MIWKSNNNNKRLWKFHSDNRIWNNLLKQLNQRKHRPYQHLLSKKHHHHPLNPNNKCHKSNRQKHNSQSNLQNNNNRFRLKNSHLLPNRSKLRKHLLLHRSPNKLKKLNQPNKKENQNTLLLLKLKQLKKLQQSLMTNGRSGLPLNAKKFLTTKRLWSNKHRWRSPKQE